MQSKIISKRLKKIADFVPNGSRLLDVGSDHAYLPIFLLQENKIQQAIAGEVATGPFYSAVKNVENYGLSDRIQVRLADGLAAFSEEDGIDVITIAGMGGRLIREILSKEKEKLSSMKRIILQPNNRENELREWLSQNNFRIVAEDILEEMGKYYEMMVVEIGEKPLNNQEISFGPFLLEEKSAVFIDKWKKEIDKLEKAVAKIPTKHEVERSNLIEKIEEIKEIVYVS